ncbi:MAG: flagellar filament capping protein FliD [Gammaproteobacteria bacterium]|nr:flagellar filament capping protein FliD [Gammaproteobacteria bacterium]MDH5728324.1 flagellar filament capping protein FliD [Gammaproteobacteria bacterium]
MATLTASGVGSGIDVASLVNQIMRAERSPFENRYDRSKTTFDAKISAFGKLKSSLSSFQEKLESLKTADNFQKRSTTSSNETAVGVDANETATLGTYNIDVTSLAKAHTLVSPSADGNYSFADKDTTAVGQGTATLEIGTFSGGTFTSTNSAVITIDASNDTLEGLRDSINAADIGVSASIIQDGSEFRLSLMSEETGTENTIKFTTTSETTGVPDNTDTSGLSRFNFDPEAGANNMTEAQASEDAVFSVNGIDLTNTSNTISTAISGVTISLQEAASSSIVKVGADQEATKATVNELIDSYNAVINTIDKLTAFGGEGNESASGVLIGDSAVFALKSRLQRIVGDVSTAGGSLSTLTEIGFKSSAEDGTLSLVDSDLDDAMTNSFDDVGNLIADYATQLDDLVDIYLNSSDGILTEKTEGFQASLDDLEEDKERFELRMESVRARYLRQFNAMDSYLAQMNSTMDYLTQQLASLPRFG